MTFARYFLPQLLFYGIGATFGAILNVRGRFAAPMWAPVLNNLVVIGSGIAFAVVSHQAPRPGHLTHNQTLILAIGTTAGVILQTVALLPSLRRVGFRLQAAVGLAQRRAAPGRPVRRLDARVRRHQPARLPRDRAAGGVGRRRPRASTPIYSYAFILFSLPYASSRSR